MSQQEKDTVFFRTLLSCHGEEECSDLRKRIRENQRNEKATRRAVFLACLLGLASLAGFGYSALFQPQVLQDTSHILFRIFAVTGLTSMICLVSYVFYWAHYRAILNKLHDECRMFLLRSLPEKLSAQNLLVFPGSVGSLDTGVDQIQTIHSEGETKLIPLPRTS